MSDLPNIAPTTEVDAVNAMIASIGERPVNTLGDVNRQDVTIAMTALARHLDDVQSRTWWFNRETKVSFSPNVDGEIEIAPNMRKVEISENSVQSDTVDRYVVRGSKLYDKTEHSSTSFTEALELDYTVVLDFEDLPQAARTYIQNRAGVTFQAQVLASDTLYTFTREDADRSYAALLTEELEHERLSLERSSTIWPTIAAHR